ncbi:MAG: hypothetical protein NZ927_00585 [Candidatus Calescibacterium sp.]|nr:hypothetical protein [Candidatus Calescibacterium sp.]MCX7733865.1 hypothetical protein [bacterium]MDW8086646.1 hypothetical protein [Candidatus Calescibacterium sp.]
MPEPKVSKRKNFSLLYDTFGKIIILTFIILINCGKENICEEKSGYILCGYCKEDVILSNNPNAGKCIYCSVGSKCSSSDPCDPNLQCISEDDGGSSSTCIPTGCPPSHPWYGCGNCWETSDLCHTRGTSNLSDDCSVCRKCP